MSNGTPRDVILRDGSTLRLRVPSRADAAALDLFFRSLSPESLIRRFQGMAALDPSLMAAFLDPDGIDRGALLGAVVEGGRERVVALGSFARLRDPSSAEVAFAVEDALQGHGVGTRLLEQLADLAGRVGIETFVAEVMVDNRPMLRVFEDAGFDVTRSLHGGGTLEVRFPIKPTIAFREHVDERDHVAVVASLRPFFEPASVAVVGASPRPDSIGGTVFRNLVGSGFDGAAHPVNGSGTAVAGVPAVRSISELPEPVELGVICVPALGVPSVAAEILESGTRALCVISAGFAETGSDGARRQESLLALVRAHGARLLGPNCLGLAHARGLNATFARGAFPPGRVAFASQSGALGLALLEAAGDRGLGFSSFVSTGNKADVSSNDLLEWWEDDEQTELVLLYVESFGNPRKFGRVARRLSRRKPILALKGGVSPSGARAAASHTAALAGSEAAVEALFHQAGVTRAHSLEELLDVASLLATTPPLRGRRVAILTNAGGLGILCADACEASGLEVAPLGEGTREALARVLPREAGLTNPVDMLGSASAAHYQRALPVLLADTGIDAVIVLFVPAATVTAEDVATGVLVGCGSSRPPKPVLAVVVSADGTPEALRRAPGVASYSYPESAARALALAARRTDWLCREAGVVSAVPGVRLDAARELVETAAQGGERWLAPAECRFLLDAMGIPFVQELDAADSEEAVSAATSLGLPVALKSAAPGLHKTDVGAVELSLGSPDDVRRAAARIGGPLVVQPMVTGGVELLAGLVQDAVFGAIVAFGPGGQLAELIGEAGFRIAPLTDTDALELVGEGKAGRLVDGFRGGPSADRAALMDLLLRLSLLGEAVPEVAELDLNPVLAFPEGCLAVDVRVYVRAAPPRIELKTW